MKMNYQIDESNIKHVLFVYVHEIDKTTVRVYIKITVYQHVDSVVYASLSSIIATYDWCWRERLSECDKRLL